MSGRDELRRALFEPEAVGIIGASDEAGKIAARPLEFLMRHGFAGDVFPINPRRDTVLGRKSYPGLDALPRKIDQAYIVLPTGSAMKAVEDCVRHGVKAISILADGFAEAGEQGLELQHKLIAMVAGTDTRVLGPNSLGLVRTWNGLSMTANAAFAHDKLTPGRCSVLSQSGSLIGTFVSRGRTRGIGFANLVSVGNEADLSIGEIGDCLIDDPRTDTFLLFLETIRHADKLAAFARRAAAAGKPVLAYKLGRSDIGAELAVSHTGALVGSDAAADALLRDLGIARVNIFETLLESPPLLRGRAAQSAKSVVTMLTTTGGGAAMVADQLGTFGIGVEGVGEKSRAALKEKGIVIKPGRIADLTLTGTRYDTVRTIMDELLVSPDTDILVSVIGSSAEFFPQQTVAPIVDTVKAAKPGHAPVAVFLVPHAEEAMKMLAEANIACFRTPEACADAIRAWSERRPPRALQEASLPTAASAQICGKTGRWTERDALELFSACGIPAVEQYILPIEDVMSKSLNESLRFPLVAKLLSADLPHKTEAGAVVVGISSPGGLRAAVARMLSAAKIYAPHARIDGVMLQPQIAAVGEVLVGLRHDPLVGAIITVGMGGTAAEIYRDVAVRVAPVSPSEAMAMFEDIRGFALFRGFRGKAKGDLSALADAVSRLSQFCATELIADVEINPVLVMTEGNGVVAVDGLVVLR
ncbi:acetate--CoA ligase family protein [Microbacteriaceae bacterium K1510]|nr:acetate--CoA ligase family protein [Microbacteriaceae bacterium K1510]